MLIDVPLQDSVLETRLEFPFSCRNMEASTLGDALGQDPTLLVFLRHFG